MLKPAERSRVNTTGVNLHALAELGVCAGFILVPAVSEPTLDLSHLPVQLLGKAIQMAGVWILCRQRKEVSVTCMTYSFKALANCNNSKGKRSAWGQPREKLQQKHLSDRGKKESQPL